MTAIPQPVEPKRVSEAPSRPTPIRGPRRRLGVLFEPDVQHQILPSTLFGFAAAAVTAGTLSLSINSLDFLRLPLLMVLAVAAGCLAWMQRRENGVWDRGSLLLIAAAVVSLLLVTFIDEYTYGHDINGVIHRSMFTSVLLILIGLPVLCNALYYVLGATPTAWDTSRYPILLYPILLALMIYGAIILKLFVEGAPGLGWDIISTSYDRELVNGQFVVTSGMKNYLLGTLLLIVMTSAIALPIGIGAGVCVAEYEGWVSNIVGFCTQMLRAISLFILAVTAFAIVSWSEGYDVGTWQSDWFRGFYYSDDGFKVAAEGSFLTASLILAMLIIPVIAKVTEEGFRSIPREMREGSVALGATEGHAFLNLMLPWAAPNIITGLILGCAEAAGSVAILLFIAGTGEFGVGPFREVTSLSFLVYYGERSADDRAFVEAMGAYTYTAALLLIFITFGLSIVATILKQRFGARYRS